ncbi:MAG: tRNA preQ1(34) S-adenosylmethionine ribosyltransferase-isomerase QueA [Byssovorax sp.]
MRRALFDFELPPERIATHPAAARDGARLLVLDPERGTLEHGEVRDLDARVAPGTLLVVNDTRVVPARLLGTKESTGGRVEILLVRRLGDASVVDRGRSIPAERWRAMGRSSKPLRPGALLAFAARAAESGAGRVVLRAQIEERSTEDGLLDVLLFTPDASAIDAALEAAGHMPLPPYLHRADEDADRERYQTVFARVKGAVAAPTAGLHLSNELLDRLEKKGVLRASVTLHVGLGTFQPVTVEDLDDHPMHTEVYEVPEETAQAIDAARAGGAAVLAVGTTVVRALESAALRDRPGSVRPGAGETRILIQPGYSFQVVDQLLTNFHLPQSTLLALVSAFAGRERVLDAYRSAVENGYRFFSYGDAMLIQSRDPRPQPAAPPS